VYVRHAEHLPAPALGLSRQRAEELIAAEIAALQAHRKTG
jgi:hypothetical protein